MHLFLNRYQPPRKGEKKKKPKQIQAKHMEAFG